MEAVEAQRTLVKSVPELWDMLSDQRMLGELLREPFGEIRIARLDPQRQIDWESDLARGRVELATSTLGTRTRLTAELEHAPESAPSPTRLRPSLLRVLLRRRRRVVMPPSPPKPAALDRGAAAAALVAFLDEVGAARHRPFSREWREHAPAGR